MSDGSSKGFLFSATLHGLAAALLFFGAVIRSDESETPKVFELVAGEGDNYMAREAPALGSPGGVSIELPETPAPRPEPPREDVIVAAPPTPPPKVESAPKKEAPLPDFQKKLRRDLIVAESRAKLQVKKQREAEAKREAEARREAERREAEARKAAADDQKRMTKEEFDRANKSKAKPAPASATRAPVKVAKIDAEGIAKGVVGGSTSNKIGGAGGKALKSDNENVLGAYFAMFKQRLRAEFEPPPGLSDSLKVDIEVRSNADGSLTGARVSKSSGSPEFDRAVLEALRRVRMPARPDRKGEVVEFTFTMRERLE